MSAGADRRWRHVVLVAGPPAAWMAHLLVSYILVPPACGSSTLLLHVATAVLITGAVGSMVLGSLGPAGGGRRPLPGGRRPLPVLILGGIFVLAIVMQGAANAVVDPCA